MMPPPPSAAGHAQKGQGKGRPTNHSPVHPARPCALLRQNCFACAAPTPNRTKGTDEHDCGDDQTQSAISAASLIDLKVWCSKGILRNLPGWLHTVDSPTAIAVPIINARTCIPPPPCTTPDSQQLERRSRPAQAPEAVCTSFCHDHPASSGRLTDDYATVRIRIVSIHRSTAVCIDCSRTNGCPTFEARCEHEGSNGSHYLYVAWL